MGFNETGKEIVDIIDSLDPNIIHYSNTHIKANTLRMMMEMVELCLAVKASPGEIMTSVMDAIHNEANKYNVYPSTFPLDTPPGIISEIARELADIEIIGSYIGKCLTIEESLREAYIGIKLDSMREWVRNGEAHLVNGCFFRKNQRK